ncbi:type I-E CRISPR-associated protein Cas6/Cse3/CasE [Kribbella sp. NPDC059898]|uniref:type I-E CRISPR-associated protein Cas6/Cse3/CasE n=1 Tax=Kribbella sp. NPDC059898 TaxID=3346995 RepID=UPI00365F07D0
MFLTRMALNDVRRGTKKLLASPQAMHAAVLAGFADPRPTTEGRVLWRLDTTAGRRPVMYVVSPHKPDFTHLVEQAGWPTTETWQTRPYDALLERLEVGQRWQFRLTANPVHSVLDEGRKRGKPMAHVTVKQQEQWLIDRTERLGFRLVPSTASGSPEPDLAVLDRSVRRFSRQHSSVTIAMTTFQGHLEVAEPYRLREAMTHGIGRAKAYGCGLLTIGAANAANAVAVGCEAARDESSVSRVVAE